jgi:hypothetical protein
MELALAKQTAALDLLPPTPLRPTLCSFWQPQQSQLFVKTQNLRPPRNRVADDSEQMKTGLCLQEHFLAKASLSVSPALQGLFTI